MRDVILGGDWTFEWGHTPDDQGKVVYSWCEDLRAGEEPVDAIVRDMREWYDSKLLEEAPAQAIPGSGSLP